MDTPLPEWKEARERLEEIASEYEKEANYLLDDDPPTSASYRRDAERIRLLLSQSAKIERLEAGEPTPEMIDAMVASLGSDDGRSAPEIALDCWLAGVRARQALADPNV